MTVQIDWNAAADADLVGAAAAGDRAAFAGIYDRYADRLYDFCLGMVGDRDAADCVQEAFCMAAVDLPTLRDPAKLRPWLYAIARHQALRALRARKRETTSDELPELPSADFGPDVLAARNELAALVAQAEGGLSDRDRDVLNLAYRHGLTGAELAQALGVSNESAKKMVQRLRDTVEKSLGALLVVRQVKSGQNNCPELAAIVTGWDGQFTILLRKRISRHIESCPDCDEERGRLVHPRVLLGASAVLIPAPAWLRDQTLTQVRLAPVATSGAVASAAHAAGHVAARLSMVTGRFGLLAVAVVAVPAVAWGLMAGGQAPNDVPLAPSRVDAPTSVTAPSQQPTVPAPGSSTPSPQPNVATPQQGSSIAPPPGPANTGDPTVGDQALQPAPSPAPVPTDAPLAPAVAPTTHAAPAAHPSTPPIASRPQRPSQPTVKHCPDGSSVTGDQSCPTPQAPAGPQCPHVAVPSNPTCGQTESSHHEEEKSVPSAGDAGP
jgi:RNA polymerase sigma factor (sigma-70 family)